MTPSNYNTGGDFSQVFEFPQTEYGERKVDGSYHYLTSYLYKKEYWKPINFLAHTRKTQKFSRELPVWYLFAGYNVKSRHELRGSADCRFHYGIGSKKYQD